MSNYLMELGVILVISGLLHRRYKMAGVLFQESRRQRGTFKLDRVKFDSYGSNGFLNRYSCLCNASCG